MRNLFYSLILSLSLAACQGSDEPLQRDEKTALPSDSYIVLVASHEPPRPGGVTPEYLIEGEREGYQGEEEGQLAWLGHLCSGGMQVDMVSANDAPTQVRVRVSDHAFGIELSAEERVEMLNCVKRRYSGYFTAGLATPDKLWSKHESLQTVDPQPFAEFYGN